MEKSKIKRLRVFAGPNGSGKSTLFKIIKEQGVSLPYFVNADDLKKDINGNHFFDFAQFDLTLSACEFQSSYKGETILFERSNGEEIIKMISFIDSRIIFPVDYQINDYFTAFLSLYIRERLLEKGDSFSFESVFSHPSKLNFIKKAQSLGYRIYLYFVSIEIPQINVERVKAREKMGGHGVAEEKVLTRYFKTMELLSEIIKHSDRAFIFDNSLSEIQFVASYDKKMKEIEYKAFPNWLFKYVISK